MISSKDLKSFKTLIEEFKPQPSFFEKQILIPQLHARLGYIKEIFGGFCEITEQDGIATMIDAAVRLVIYPPPLPGVPEPEVGRQYLQQIRAMMIESFILVIDRLRERYPLEGLVNGDIDQMASFLNESKMVFESVSAVREKMFQLAFRGVVNVRDMATGEVRYAPTAEISIILAPFETRMGELVSVASSASDSIKIWSQNQKEQANKHVDVVTNVSQVYAAHEQTVAARWNIIFQIVVITFAIVGIVLSQPVGTYVEKRLLESAYQEKVSEAQSYRNHVAETSAELEQRISNLENDLKTCRSNIGAGKSAK